MNMPLYFLSEFVGTAMLLLMGCGCVAHVALPSNKGSGGGMLMVTWGWGLAVFAGVMVASYSGAILNPGVGIGLLLLGKITFRMFCVATSAQLLGAMTGATLMYLAYKPHFDQDVDPAIKLGVFATIPEIRRYGWNLITEIVGTFVLVFVVLAFADYGDIKIGTPHALGPLAGLPVALLVVGIGICLGGPTGYAINPVRDLGPRLAHAMLPIRGKGRSDWCYAWVPVVGPLVGGALAAGARTVLQHLAS